MPENNEEISIKGTISGIRAPHLFSNIIIRISIICNRVGTTLILFMMLLTTLDVILRGTLKRPITGAFEATQLMMLMVIALGLSYTQYRKGHVSVSLVTSHFSPGAKDITDIFIKLICIGIYALISWQAIAAGLRQYAANTVINDVVRAPIYPFYYMLAFGTIVLCLVFVLDIIDTLHSLQKRLSQ